MRRQLKTSSIKHRLLFMKKKSFSRLLIDFKFRKTIQKIVKNYLLFRFGNPCFKKLLLKTQLHLRLNKAFQRVLQSRCRYK